MLITQFHHRLEFFFKRRKFSIVGAVLPPYVGAIFLKWFGMGKYICCRDQWMRIIFEFEKESRAFCSRRGKEKKCVPPEIILESCSWKKQFSEESSFSEHIPVHSLRCQPDGEPLKLVTFITNYNILII